jgi:hypothetical protein
LPLLSVLLPTAIYEVIDRVRDIAIDLFTSNPVKAPSDVLTNEISNTFLHTYYGGFLLSYLHVPSKQHVKRYLDKLTRANKSAIALY